ncbi:MAG TPA: molybdate ABC transporter substrate-binding protein [Acidimicrobiia bacterium]|nr:molybdate ABC transporter substrate-binding protein [Acidimicrobiia bacterium]
MKRAIVALAGVAALLAGVQPAGAGGQKPSGEITVFAAASLTESFDAIAKQFEKKYSDVDVKFNYDASSNLATQINQGAPADVFASADEDNLNKTIGAGTATPPPVVFAKNRLEIAVEKGNPKKIKSLSDLQKSGLVVVLCADQVPCGKYAAESRSKAGVSITPASKEENAKATLSKVSIGEADASIVYVTDVKAAKGTTRGVKIPDKVNVIATYPMAVVKSSQNATAAKAWEQFVMSKEGQKTLRKFGFLPP